jgi:hypothetical protein
MLEMHELGNTVVDVPISVVIIVESWHVVGGHVPGMVVVVGEQEEKLPVIVEVVVL